jgi:hypothetical protein
MGAIKELLKIRQSLHLLNSLILRMTVQSLLQLVLETCWALMALLGPLFTKQIAAGGPITITHPDIIIMTIPEVCQLVLRQE